MPTQPSWINSKFDTIVADPPWPYGTRKAITGTVKSDGSIARTVGDTGYDFLPMNDLLQLPVAKVAHTNSHLYLWTTNSFMVEAHIICREWGFEPKTIITWGKVSADGKPSMKTGYYFRGATEHILFGVRGSRKLSVNRGEPTLQLSKRLPHSVKPDWFYALVERCSPGETLELFARRQYKRWWCWGNQIEKHPPVRKS